MFKTMVNHEIGLKITEKLQIVLDQFYINFLEKVRCFVRNQLRLVFGKFRLSKG